MSVTSPTLCLIDGSGYIFRAFYALPQMYRQDGTPTNAVYGFTSMMLNLLQENCCQQLVVVFDAKRENFRNKIYSAYKMNRRETPDELIPQFSLIRDACDALNISWTEQEGFEADDLIATYARIAKERGQQVRIISADKDLMQLMDTLVTLYDPMKKKDITEDDVIHKFGVSSKKVIEVQSLMGDSVDNIPGARGIGPKTAADFIQKYGSIENLYEHLNEIKSEKQKQKLLEDKEQVFISKQLVTLNTTVPVDTNLERFNQKELDTKKLIKFLNENNFPSLIKKIKVQDFSQPQGLTATPSITIHELKTANDFLHLKEEISGIFSFEIKANNQNISDLFFSINSKTIYHYAWPVQPTDDLFSTSMNTPDQDLVSSLNMIFSLNVPKLSYDIKAQKHILSSYGIELSEPYNDIQLMAYDLDNHQDLSIENLVSKYLHLENIISDHNALHILNLYTVLRQNLENENLYGIYHDVDLPLIQILFDMEKTGILVDQEQLTHLNTIFTEKLNTLTQKIYSIAQEEFNINSPAQLGVILFEKRGLSGGKRGPSGHWITDVKVLENLSENGDELAKLVLDYRSISKLKSTYVEDLLKRYTINKRIHTTYSLVNTNTGRLASSNPNLQNIPIRSDDGKNIRQAFIARPGYKLISADYSQIELRLMADVANVQKLKESFLNGEDIHARTASQILNVPLEQITSDQRRQAKAVNFGIIYGISAFGLARNLGISRTEANQYIDAYFKQYPEIKIYMDETIKFVDTNGYVETPFGRRIYIDGLTANNTKQFAHRAAINAPIQGGAADIIKMAMIRTKKALFETNIDATLLLQIHDELIFEVAEKDIVKTEKIIKENMEKVVSISVPLISEIGHGANWRDAH